MFVAVNLFLQKKIKIKSKIIFLKEAVSVISSDPVCKDGNARFQE